MTAYYNENDEYVAQWLWNLIAAGHIAPGDVDDRSIEDICPDDLRGYAQAHFFAGIGVWSYSLRRAGWPDDRPVWTGSCPCQPFSAAGKGAGFTDERHLWPAWFHLIGERRPPVIFGEQVAGKNGLAWLDLVQADLEGLDYACGAVPAPAAGFGAPHIRERLYWTAVDQGEQSHGSREARGRWRQSANGCSTGRMADNNNKGCEGWDGGELQECTDQRAPGPRSSSSRMGDSESERREWRTHDGDEGRRQCTSGQTGEVSERSGPVNGFWRDADWLLCTDGKWRPVEPGTFPLVDGCPARVDKLRSFGNAINAEEATAFIEVAMQVAP